MPITVSRVQDLRDLTFRSVRLLGKSEWFPVSQERINQFAEATGDDQWIHVDIERAKSGPFGAPIAHGYLTMSLIPFLLRDVMTFDESSVTIINLGGESFKFRQPVVVGSSVRLAVELIDIPAFPGGGVQLKLKIFVEVESSDKHALVAEVNYLCRDNEG